MTFASRHEGDPGLPVVITLESSQRVEGEDDSGAVARLVDQIEQRQAE